MMRPDLDAAHEALLRGASPDDLDRLILDLRETRFRLGSKAWPAYVAETCLRHPVRDLLHRDPITWRAFSKPRGYAGDAGTIDLIYYPDQYLPELSEEAAALYSYTSACPSSRAVRNRRAITASSIDQTVAAGGARVLSVACGHMRELDLIAPSASSASFVALDQDESSLSVLAADYSTLDVKPVAGSIGKILRRQLGESEFDLIYSTGLFDYLDERVGKALVSRLFELLSPGGTLSIANFTPETRDIGYMEAFMGWNLIYRTEFDLLALASGLPFGQIGDLLTTRDDTGCVAFLSLTKRRLSAAAREAVA